MTYSGRWFHPGPVEAHPDVKQAMLRPVFHHQSDRGRELLQRIQPTLRKLFRTERTVFTQTATPLALMEGAIRCGVRDRVLCVIGGTFGERFAELAERCDKEVIRLRVPRGGVLEPELLRQLLDGPPVDAVTMVHSESSSGALAPIQSLLPLLRRLEDVVTIVDAVGSIGATPVETDAWGIDMVIAGSQKALAVPPGIALGVASERFLARSLQSVDRGRYCDIPALQEAAREDRFPQSPAVPIYHALDAQLERIAVEGIEARERRHTRMRERVEEWVLRDGRCQLIAPPGRRSDALSALRLPADIRAPILLQRLHEAGWEVGAGRDEDRESVIRIGHMGELTPQHVDALLVQIEQVL